MGLIELSKAIKDTWSNHRDDIIESSDQITETLKKINSELDMQSKGQIKIAGSSLIEKTIIDMMNRFEPVHGGFSKAPKFPSTHNIIFLLRAGHTNQKSFKKIKEMVRFSLDHIRRGGIFDHIGYGFHRYSTDNEWLLPHFEKMLYDQAMLLLACAEYQFLTQDKMFETVTRKTIEYVLRDMTSEEGGFFSAEDADSEGEEGKFYVWEYDELEKILNEEELTLIEQVYGIRRNGNFLDEASRRPTYKNIFHLTDSEENLADHLKLSSDKLENKLKIIRKKLFQEREKRVHPHKDDKILTDWNGLMIAALSRAALVLNEPVYSDAAQKCANFILKKLSSKEGLLHRYRDGETNIRAFLSDYSAFIWGLIELYEATFEADHLKEAILLADEMIELFWDDKKGGFFFTAHETKETKEAEKMILRHKEWHDGALPSGNSIACYVIIRLGELTGNSLYSQKAEKLLDSIAGIVEPSPSHYSFMMMSLNYLLSSRKQTVILCENIQEIKSTLSELRKEYDPNETFLVIDKPRKKTYDSLIEYTKQMTLIEEKATIYRCRDFACEKPVPL